MAHITKFKASAMGQMFAHINRDDKQTRKYSNAEIDASKTHLNFDLLSGDMATLQSRLDQVAHSKRSDLVVCCGVVVTLPEELKEARDEQKKSFFKECHEFLNNKFGKENCVYSVAHFDETTPHLHYGFVPVVEKEIKYRSKEKRGQTYKQERVCADDVITRTMLNTFHDELQAHISKTFPDVRIVAEDKQKRMKQSKSIAELKEETKKRMESKEKQLDQVYWEANIWKGVAESWKDDAREMAKKAEQTAKQEAKEIAKKLAAAEAQKQIQQAQEAIESLRQLADKLAKRKFEKKTGIFGIRLSEDEYADLYSKASIDTELKTAKETLNDFSNKHLQDLETANKDLESKNKALKNENENLKEQSENAQNAIKDATDRAENAERERDEAQDKVKRLEETNKELTLQNSFFKRLLRNVWELIKNHLHKDPKKAAEIRTSLEEQLEIKQQSRGRSI